MALAKIFYLKPRGERMNTYTSWDSKQIQKMKVHKRKIFEGMFEVDLSDKDELLLIMRRVNVAIPIKGLVGYYYGHTGLPVEWSEIQHLALDYDLSDDDFDLIIRFDNAPAIRLGIYEMVTTYMREELGAIPNGYEQDDCV